MTTSDYDVADILRRSKKPVILVVNKIDDYSEDKIFEFYSLGLGEPYPPLRAVNDEKAHVCTAHGIVSAKLGVILDFVLYPALFAYPRSVDNRERYKKKF